MQTIELVNLDAIAEARRQIEICNACRYCESYCAVFPAVHSKRAFSDGDIQQLSNLCHNCRGCYYACQYTAPHEFGLNLPKALAEVRQESWESHARPGAIAKIFHRSGTALSLFVVLAAALLVWLIQVAPKSSGEGFYSLMSHNAMVLLFVPAFTLPILLILLSLRGYWQTIGGEPVRWRHVVGAFGSIAKMKNLSGGHGDGCNFEAEDAFSNSRRRYHQATMYGFLLCFAATSVATLMHYGLEMSAPYGIFSLPKLLGIPGGVLLSIGTLGLASLKLKADRELADARVWGGEMAFVLLLFVVSTSGLALYFLRETRLLNELLSLHLGAVLALFLLMPFSKMVHGFFRLAALIRDEQCKA
ncbi:tricarballylate utilization 4Fe-4S protein TcuB [Marinobacterium sp. D7]|uniref:tricarballylate utilization 4Fe-4S protein TcuB n=1 Tax=Marinobacterium ramblicola TaxID=2849041 RepID=UPI001C2CC9B2|nr:tricarballylate utilization 4Fe-4S protein TcuB [Marinobacterium ramblicola]MBV1789486.1 tricarballylate utilization 4Fe-4S protein TcuB [Marinobacterium ramblicola]